MKNKDINLNLGNIGASLKGVMSKVNAYRAFIFFLLVAALYGYILFRINTLSNLPPSQADASTQASAQPHIDQATVDKIENLKDNSVSVQALFDEARQNPFNE